MEGQDLRAKVAATVARVGVAVAAEGLGPTDRATLLMADHYVAFRAGEVTPSFHPQAQTRRVFTRARARHSARAPVVVLMVVTAAAFLIK